LALISPTLVIVLAAVVLPIVWSISLAFQRVRLINVRSAGVFAGYTLHNFHNVFTAPGFLDTLRTTVLYSVLGTASSIGLGLIAALALRRTFRGRGFVRSAMLLPYVAPVVAVTFVWQTMLSPQFGVINSLLGSLGFGQVEWLTKQRMALMSVILVDTWQWTPFIMLIALAGLTAVPKYLYEAASIDRASEWFRFRHITLPLVWPLLLIAVLFRAIEAFRLFDLVYILTNGGPGVSTETLSFHVYKVAFLGFDTGIASAYGILMVIVVIILAQFLLRYLEKLRED